MRENEEGDEENERLLYLHKNIETKLAKFAVVPHAGTWIEIALYAPCSLNPPSFPTRERGLKYRHHEWDTAFYNVVPHAGTWIEIPYLSLFTFTISVVPHAGTWIEIKYLLFFR